MLDARNSVSYPDATEGEDGTITMNLHSAYEGKTKVTADIADVESFRTEMMDVIQAQTEAGTLHSYDFKPEDAPSAFDLVLPLLVLFFCCLLPQFINSLLIYHSYFLAAFLGGILALYVGVFIGCAKKYMDMKNKKK